MATLMWIARCAQRGCLSVFFLMLIGTAAHAGLFDSLFGSKRIDCTPLDRACLLKTTIAIELQEFTDRDYKPNVDPHAKAAGELLVLVPADQRDAFRESWRQVGADDEFFKTLDESADIAPDTSWITLDVLQQALETQKSPDGEDFASFTKKAFPIVLTKQPAEGIALWEKHFRMLWDNAYGSVTTVFNWMTLHDLPALERYTSRYILPKSNYYNPWEELGRVAANYCSSGDTTSGERILRILENDKDGWKPDRELKAVDWSKMTSGVLSCRGEPAAMAMVGPVFAQMNDDIAAAKQKYSDQKGLAFVLGVITSEVAENMIQPIVLWLYDQGRHEEARQLYVRLPSQEMSNTIDSMANDGILGSTFADRSFDELVKNLEDAAFYSGDPKVSLRWFMDKYNPAPDSCCADGDTIARAIDNIGLFWPDPLARDAAQKALALLGRFAKSDKDYWADNFDIARLRIAALERRTEGCALGEDRLAGYLTSIAGYPLSGQRGPALSRYLRYLDVVPVIVTGTSCLVQ